ncbi:MAG: ParB/RepB/Spo0J family partition protein [Bdellovibrionales bacterium]|nr:ParB/RepB/Spo0J family partition protein [Bdellovibrionales bacterium]
MSKKKVTFDINPLLSGPSLDSRARTGSPFRFIPLADVDIDPDQPRRVFDQERLQELAESIREYGVISPILVRISGGGTFRLVAGERRFRACKLLGLDTIPAIVDAQEEEGEGILSKQLVENIQREDLTPMERALAIGQLQDRYSLSVRDIAKRLGVSKSMVQRSLEILQLPDDLQAALIAGAPESKVLLLRHVEDRALRKKLIAELDELSRSSLEQLLAGLPEDSQKSQLSHRGTVRSVESSTEDQRIVEDLQQSISMKVSLRRDARKPEAGKLTIDFYSTDDLNDLFERLTR